MKVDAKQDIKNMPFKSGGFYNITAQIQENTLLNRGLLDVGGIAIPQMMMSNNKDESIERGVMEAIYFVSSFVAPYAMLPLFNRSFLLKQGIVKNFKNNEKRIIEVSKNYLTKDANFMIEGIRKTAEKLELDARKNGKNINIKKDFENILNRFSNKEELRNKLIMAHENVLFSDFLATSLMWCATPWAAMETTKFRTKRSGFSATYGMIDEKQSKINAQKHEKEKKKKLLTSAFLAIVPAIAFSKLISCGIKSNNPSNIVKKFAKSFNYTKGIFPSKAIFAAIWILADYPSQIISSRDKYERRDRAIRSGANIIVFFGGDYILNNIFGRLADKTLGTKIMDKSKIKENAGFFQKLKLLPKNFSEMDDIKNISPSVLKKTKNVGAGLYWTTLVANMALLGFAVPSLLNKMLRNSVKKDSEKNKS